MLIKHGDLQPIAIIESEDISDEEVKKALNQAKNDAEKQISETTAQNKDNN